MNIYLFNYSLHVSDIWIRSWNLDCLVNPAQVAVFHITVASRHFRSHTSLSGLLRAKPRRVSKILLELTQQR